MTSLFIISIFIFCICSQTFASDSCTAFLRHNLNKKADSTNDFIAYLAVLLENRVIKDNYYFGSSDDDLMQYAWYNENSNTPTNPGGSTHPVAQLKPLIVGFRLVRVR
ncbi:MAG: hypothetical protein A2Z20_03520 [Bdellovibrionales bacterium RBG_16_40_8]|nr:MAG: hypothetical protein A2Z20_03520 [Bdellovibrionales bacterium RBG_16_40_8]